MPLTKTDLKKIELLFGKIFDKKFAENFDKRFDLKFAENFDKRFDLKFAENFDKRFDKRFDLKIKEHGLLTRKDLPLIRKLMGLTIEEKVPQELKKHLSYLPTKKEFFEAMDKVMGELKKIREEHRISAYRVSDHEERIFVLEKIHPNGQHPSSFPQA